MDCMRLFPPGHEMTLLTNPPDPPFEKRMMAKLTLAYASIALVECASHAILLANY